MQVVGLKFSLILLPLSVFTLRSSFSQIFPFTLRSGFASQLCPQQPARVDLITVRMHLVFHPFPRLPSALLLYEPSSSPTALIFFTLYA